MPLILKEQIGASVSICIWQINETKHSFRSTSLKEADLNHFATQTPLGD